MSIPPIEDRICTVHTHRILSPEVTHMADLTRAGYHFTMKTIGLIGGMAWESSAEYYRLANQEVKRRLGGQHNAKSIMFTVDFAEVEAMQRAGDWPAAAQLLSAAATTLEKAGADLVLLCTNTMHQVAAEVEAAITVPFLHIVDATAKCIGDADMRTVALLGTRFTMEMDFYRDRMRSHEIAILTPDTDDRSVVHDIIYNELTQGVVNAKSRREYQRIITDMAARGATGVIFGCTEITLLLSSNDSPLPVFDSTQIHVDRAIDLALES